MPWNTSNLTVLNDTNFTVTLRALNGLSSGWFGLTMLFVVFVVSFMGLSMRFGVSTMRAYAAASFVTFLVCLPLAGLGLVGGVVFWVVVANLLLAVAGAWMS